jgi:transcriptional regulator with XRE-family HTH domain
MITSTLRPTSYINREDFNPSKSSNRKKSLRSLAKELGVSASYLSQVKNGVRPASGKLLNNSSFEMLNTLLNTKKNHGEKHPNTHARNECGTPGATRTPDTRFRKPLLYPPELLGHDWRFANSDSNILL